LVVQSLNNDPSLQVSTLKTKIRHLKDITDPNNVKVVTDSRGMALYFSRSPIPYERDGRNGGEQAGPEAPTEYCPEAAFKHIGVYAYRRPFLLEFTGWGRSPLEQIEKLEQLRILERGGNIKVEETLLDSLGVDVPEDIMKIEQALNEMEMS
ncbi:MAG: 3-deoxy-manno-octulosonate cytidylyltransferase, partial [Nitrospinae bacterium]|nr:3-deoxy-manno-octulosonate cytidylyltransferase [Nitrospinota bacterium]